MAGHRVSRFVVAAASLASGDAGEDVPTSHEESNETRLHRISQSLLSLCLLLRRHRLSRPPGEQRLTRHFHPRIETEARAVSH